MSPSQYRLKRVGWYLLGCQALELGEDGRAGMGVIQVVQQTRPLRPDKQAIELEGGPLRIDWHTNFAAISCPVHCLSQGLEPLADSFSDLSGNGTILARVHKECSGKEIAARQDLVFHEFQPVVAKRPDPFDSSLNLLPSRIYNLLKEDVSGACYHRHFQFFLGTKVDEQAALAHSELFR